MKRSDKLMFGLLLGGGAAIAVWVGWSAATGKFKIERVRSAPELSVTIGATR